ncbi:hypothetical protein [Lysobacter antibioticus]|uniref:DUF4412 domain-containing protein n=1 Tax=Lysobacter antibioticus TaxID=84531 RepID=A0A0S2F711_LYSAN|nr:hypothetical protein [Lysobacter antibioticus]ALN79307.1 hypothetical protein LA76x_1148 [Lysobacter antibioticus]
MLKAYRSARLMLAQLVLAMLPCWAQAADPVEDRQRAALAGHYYLEGADDAGSELVLEPDGRFQWSLSYGLLVESASGLWNVGGNGIVLSVQPPAGDQPVFSLDQVVAWTPDAQKRLDEFAAERQDALIEEACGYLKTYQSGFEYAELVAASLSAATPVDRAGRSAAEASLAPALAALEQSRLALEATAAQTKPKAWQAPPLSNAAAVAAGEAAAGAAAAGADDGGAEQNGMPQDGIFEDGALEEHQVAADIAVRTYLQRFEQAVALHAKAGRAMPKQPAPRFDRERCLDPAAKADGRGGYAVVIGDPQRGYRAQGIGVEFVYSDGRSERTETSPGGWALAVQRPGVRLAQAILQPADRPRETLALDESKGRIFAIRLDTAAAMPASFEQLILTQDDGDLIAPRIPGRYVRH